MQQPRAFAERRDERDAGGDDRHRFGAGFKPSMVTGMVVAAAGGCWARTASRDTTVAPTARAVAATRPTESVSVLMTGGACCAPHRNRAARPAPAPMARPAGVFQRRAAGSCGVTAWRKIVGPRLGKSQAWPAQSPSAPMTPITEDERSTA